MIKIYLRPYISDNRPKIIPPRNIPIENIAKVIPTHCSVSQKPRIMNGKDGIMSPKPIISKRMVSKIIGKEDLFEDI